MSSTQISNPGLDPAIAALIPNGNEIYDAIMGSIEPELLSANLPLLSQKYGNESVDLRQSRMQRYKEAFQRYDAAYTNWITNVRQVVQAKRADAIQKAEVRVQQQDAAALANLENQFTL